MDWIMDIPAEVVIGFWIGVGGLISAIFALIVALFVGAKRIVDALSERKEADLMADKRREDQQHEWSVKWEKQLEEKSDQINQLQDRIRQAEVSQAEERGKVIILQDTMKYDREARQKERAELLQRIDELLQRIDELEKRIAELEHENQSKDELLKRKDGLIKQLIAERDEALAELETLNTKHLAIVIELNEVKEKLDDCKDDEPKDEKITELKQPENDKEEKAS